MLNGILNIYKEKGFTSHDVVARLRGILKQKKIGHTGTLDPDAEGVLPVCLGRATKVCDLLTDKNKTYRAVLLLGTETDTQDVTGTVLASKECTATEAEIRECILSFLGEQEQVPPMYSALKVNGKKLYELARQGIEIERKARPVTFFQIDIEEINLPEVIFSVTCSKGTYIRTLCHDIGKKLGCGGCMKHLLRTKVGPFSLENTIRLEQVSKLQEEGRILEIVAPIDSVFGTLRKISLKERAEIPVYNGNPFVKELVEGEIEAISDEEQVLVYRSDGEFLAVYKWRADRSLFWPVKMFYLESNLPR